jgi:hypothetical protein
MFVPLVFLLLTPCPNELNLTLTNLSSIPTVFNPTQPSSISGNVDINATVDNVTTALPTTNWTPSSYANISITIKPTPNDSESNPYPEYPTIPFNLTAEPSKVFPIAQSEAISTKSYVPYLLFNIFFVACCFFVSS